MDYRMAAFCQPWEFFATFYCYFIFIDKERSPEILVQLNLRLYDTIERSIFPVYRKRLITHCPFDCDNMKFKISSQILYHAIPLVHLSYP